MRHSRGALVFLALTLIISTYYVGLIDAPGYTDAFYHYNAAVRLAGGQGLTEPYLWTYVGAPERLPETGVFPSHLYWMPFTSISAAAGIVLFGGGHAGAQTIMHFMFVGMVFIAYWLGDRLGGTARYAWLTGLLALFSGFFVRYWGVIDTFAPFALVGSACLILLGLAYRDRADRIRLPLVLVAGVCAGFGHLTRADGLLLLLVGMFVLLVQPGVWRIKGVRIALLVIGYLAVMGLWFARNQAEVGTFLPLGGTQAFWFRSYDDLFNYPPGAAAAAMFADGFGVFLASRWEAFTNNLGTFVAVEGLIVLAPLMLIGLWNRRREPFWLPFALYAVGLHGAFTFIFPYPGYRGGLLHSAAALIPCWAFLGISGLDDVIAWVGKRRRWRIETAQMVFSGALVAYAVGLSLSIAQAGRVSAGEPSSLYRTLDTLIPADARVMINDPAMLYTFTGRGGVVVPNAAPDMIPLIAERYRVDYLVLERSGIPAPLQPAWDVPPTFLTELTPESNAAPLDWRIFRIDHEAIP
ncbi:MAG: hypothetical protein SF162_00455 [bacterium]|nr:hypothetical protein [bacterium]